MKSTHSKLTFRTDYFFIFFIIINDKFKQAKLTKSMLTIWNLY